MTSNLNPAINTDQSWNLGNRRDEPQSGMFTSMAEFQKAGGAAANPGPVWIGPQNALSNSAGLVKQKLRDPRIVENLLPANYKYLDNVSGTFTAPGTKTPVLTTNEYGVKSETLLLETNTSGRAIISPTITLTANQWYALSFELLDKTATLNGLCGLVRFSGATIDQGSFDITNTKLNSGGVGRYCSVFKSVAGGSLVFRLGVGTSSSTTGMMMKIANLQLEAINTTKALCCSEYVYPGYKAAYPYVNPCTIDANNKVSQATDNLSVFPVKPFSTLLVVGDSRNDERTDIGGQLNTLLAGTSLAYRYAEGGWQTSSVIGPTIDSSHAESVTVTLANALAGNVGRCSESTAGYEEIWDYKYPGALPFDTLVICDLGYNDINLGKSVSETFANYVTMCEMAVASGLRVIITDNNPYSAGATWSQGNWDKLLELSALAQQYCAQKGHLFFSCRTTVGDATSIDKLSDGASTTPNYSADGLHMNSAGATAFATVLKAVIDENR